MKKLLFYFLLYVLFVSDASAIESFADLAEKTMPSVVNISTKQNNNDGFFEENEKMQTLGSGFIISEDGYIVTNNHVIKNSEIINVIVGNDKKFVAKQVGADEKTDIALIKIDTDEKLQPVVFANSDNIRVGDWVLAIGNPFGLGGSITAGIVSAKSRDIDSGSYDDFIQTDASINQGNSGGPMFNTHGEVIGMNTSIFSTTGNSIGIGFATPSNIIVWVIDQLKTYGKVNRGWIGIKMHPDFMENIDNENCPIKKGVLVLGVAENSPAQKVGISAGDIIIKVDNKQIKNPKSFSRIIATKKAGEQILLSVWNNQKIRDVAIDVIQTPKENSKTEKEQKKNIYSIEDIGLISQNIDGEIVIEEPYKEAFDNNLEKGDIIIKIDGYNISSPKNLEKYIKNLRFSEEKNMVLSILKNGEIKNVTIKLENTNEQN